MSPFSDTGTLVGQVQTLTGAWGSTPKTWDTSGPLVSGLLPQGLPDPWAVAT